MPYYQEGCNVDSFAYVSVLKHNISSAKTREYLSQYLHWLILDIDFSWNG
jgi:hypothetical protein